MYFLFLLYFFLTQSLCSPGWPQIHYRAEDGHDPFASAWLQACVTVPHFCDAEDWTWYFVYDRQAFYLLNYNCRKWTLKESQAQAVCSAFISHAFPTATLFPRVHKSSLIHRNKSLWLPASSLNPLMGLWDMGKLDFSGRTMVFGFMVLVTTPKLPYVPLRHIVYFHHSTHIPKWFVDLN